MSNFNFTFGNHRYELVQQDLSWDAAAAKAKALGGYLANIGSEEENTAVFQAVAAQLKNTAVPVAEDGGGSAYLWLGASDLGSEGSWHWQDKSELVYNNWGFGPWGQEPDNYTDPQLAPDGQNGAALALEAWPKNLGGLGTAGQWNDVSQHNKLWSVVEYDMPSFVLKGGAGADLLDADPKGNNQIDGGDGVDTVRVHAKQEDYQLSRDDKGVHLVGNDNRVDLSNVERVRFDDGAMAFDIDGNGGKAYRLYQAAFAREPDADGLGFWMAAFDKGSSLEELSAFFVASKEFIELNGSELSHENFVVQMYSNVLHRAPEKDGLDFWLGLMDKGMGEARVLAFFSESPENQAQVLEVIGNGFNYTPQL